MCIEIIFKNLVSKELTFNINMYFHHSQVSFTNHNSVHFIDFDANVDICVLSHNQYCYCDLLSIYNLHRQITQHRLKIDSNGQICLGGVLLIVVRSLVR